MRKFRRKNFKGLCPKCNRVRILRLVNQVWDLGVVWLRCTKCLGTHNYPASGLLKTGRALTESQVRKRNRELSQVKDYSPRGTYWVGQKIRHPKFQEVGKVVKKQTTAGRHGVILVEFEDKGLTKLVEGS